MAEVVLRIRLIGADSMNVRYEETATQDAAEVAEHALAVLPNPAGWMAHVREADAASYRLAQNLVPSSSHQSSRR